MSFAFLPVYTGDYRRKTGHLSPLKHGIYLLLLMHCWDTKGPAPLDEQECAGIANCRSTDEIDALRYILSRFFVQMTDGHYNKRIQVEIERAEAISRARSNAGKRGYEALAKHLRGKSRASAGQVPITPTPTLTLTPIKVKSDVGLTPDPAPENLIGKALRDAAKRVLETLNHNAGRRYEPVDANLKPIIGRIREGYTEQELKAIAAVKARQWRGDEKMEPFIRPKTLYNATNAAQYRAELPVNQMESTDFLFVHADHKEKA